MRALCDMQQHDLDVQHAHVQHRGLIDIETDMHMHSELTGAAHRQASRTIATNVPERIMVASGWLMAGGRVQVSVLPMMVCFLKLFGPQKGRQTAVHAKRPKSQIYTAAGLQT
jgi:hypothetical protein